MGNSNIPGSNQNIDVQIRGTVYDPNVTVQYKTKILQKNVIDGVNTLTQEMVSSTNTKYVIKYDYVLGEDITVPINCVLEFDGGSINGNNLITLQNTAIAGDLNIGIDTNIVGKIKNINAITPQMFGYKEGLYTDEQTTTKIFRKWIDYVNSTDGCYFSLPNYGYGYHIFEPWLLKKSIIGISLPVIYYMQSAIGKVISSTEMSAAGNYNYNIKGVIGIKQTSYNPTVDRFTIKNLKIYCNQGNIEDDSQDVGLYFPEGNAFCVDNVTVLNSKTEAFLFREIFQVILTRLYARNSKGIGFNFEGTNTSITMQTCYVHNCAGVAYRFYGIQYSNFNSLAADGCRGTSVYGLIQCSNIVLTSIGIEECDVQSIFAIGGVNRFGINGLELVGCTATESIFYFNSSTCTGYIKGVSFIHDIGNISHCVMTGALANADLDVDTDINEKYLPNETSLYIFYSSYNGAISFIRDNSKRIKVLNGAVVLMDRGSTAERPVLTNFPQYEGFSFYDTTIDKPLWWTINSTYPNGAWVDATGATV